MLYFAIIAFQAFCIFHVYKSRNEKFWYFVIFFVPVIGALVYLFTQILNKSNVKNAGTKITTVVSPGKKLKDLKKKYDSSETFQNAVNLADAYQQKQDFENAIIYYEKALSGKLSHEAYTINKTIKCYFAIKNYKAVVANAGKIDINKNFRGSLCIYAISLEKCGLIEEAELQFKKVDIRYCNYVERLELSKFLIRQNKNEEAKTLLNEVVLEIKNMMDTNKRKHRFINKEAKSLLSQIKDKN